MFIDMLDDLFAPLVLEIDIDVGRLLAFLDMKRSNKRLARVRAYGRNAEAITNQRIGGRAAALAKNAFRRGKLYNVVDRQKISGAIQLFDNREFLGQGVLDVRRNPAGYRRLGPSFVKATSASCGRCIAMAEFAGIIRLELIQREPATLQEARRLADGLGCSAKKPRHLFGGFQMPLGIGRQKRARLLQCPMLPNAGDDVLKRPAFGRVIKHVIHGDQRDSAPSATSRKPRQPAASSPR